MVYLWYFTTSHNKYYQTCAGHFVELAFRQGTWGGGGRGGGANAPLSSGLCSTNSFLSTYSKSITQASYTTITATVAAFGSKGSGSSDDFEPQVIGFTMFYRPGHGLWHRFQGVLPVTRIRHFRRGLVPDRSANLLCKPQNTLFWTSNLLNSPKMTIQLVSQIRKYMKSWGKNPFSLVVSKSPMTMPGRGCIAWTCSRFTWWWRWRRQRHSRPSRPSRLRNHALPILWLFRPAE